MKYRKFIIENYRAIVKPLEIDVSKGIIPLVGVNECGKTTILQALFCFDCNNDKINEGRHLKNIMNLYETIDRGPCKITAVIEVSKDKIQSSIEAFILKYREEMNTAEKENDKINEEMNDYDESDEMYATLQNQLKTLGVTYKKHALLLNRFENLLESVQEAFGRKKLLELSIIRELAPNNDDKSATGFYFCDLFGDDADLNGQVCGNIVSH